MKIDLEKCPEIIIFAIIHELGCKHFKLYNKYKKNLHDPKLVSVLDQMVEISKYLTRFGIVDPVSHYYQSDKTWLVGEVRSWYENWFKYWNNELSNEQYKQLTDDIRKWIKNNNYDLSKWRPNKS